MTYGLRGHNLHLLAYAKSSKSLQVGLYTDGQRKRYTKSLSCIACGSQTRGTQAYHDNNLESNLWVNIRVSSDKACHFPK